MKTQHTATATAATAIALILNAGVIAAAEPQFNVPETALARDSAEVLTHSARIFSDSRWASALASRGTQISNVWLYPTGNGDTVFAKYTLTSNEGSASPSEHLALLTVREDGNVRLRELTDAPAEPAAANTTSSRGPHWSASVGAGHSSEGTTDSGPTHGAPASPHWTAVIGTGNATQNPGPEATVSAQPNQSIADAHWTSKIGSGDASESNARRTTKTTSTAVASVPAKSE